jgi:RNA polymerase sigma factor (sigma-70 family)
MAVNKINGFIRRLRRDVLQRDAAGLTDGELLELYLAGRNEAAFEVLLHRHGAMVLGVCRRVLHNEADAEDAFQATFLVFVRKASSIRTRATVSNWLYGVAHNTALKAKAMNHKRHTKERAAASVPRDEAPSEVWREIHALLDGELSHLPDKYRIPIVLCDLEGKTITEAARRLGWPQGTVATRLTRGRAQLAERLTKQWLTLTGSIAATVMSSASAQGTMSACVPASLAATTVQAATAVAAGQAAAKGLISTRVVALTEGVVKAMSITKLKTLAILVVAVMVLGGGGAIVGYSSLRAEPQANKQMASSVAPSSDDQTARAAKADEDGAEAKEAQARAARARAEAKEAEAREARAKAEAKEAEAREARAKAESKEAEAKEAEAREARAKAESKEAEAKESEAKESQAKADAREAEAREARAKKARSDKQAFRGTWVAVRGEQNGEKIPREKLNAIKLIFTEDKVTLEGYEPSEGMYTIDSDKKPNEIDMFSNAAVPLLGIYELKGKTLKLICKRDDRPNVFNSQGGRLLLVLEKK